MGRTNHAKGIIEILWHQVVAESDMQMPNHLFLDRLNTEPVII